MNILLTASIFISLISVVLASGVSDVWDENAQETF